MFTFFLGLISIDYYWNASITGFAGRIHLKCPFSLCMSLWKFNDSSNELIWISSRHNAIVKSDVQLKSIHWPSRVHAKLVLHFVLIHSWLCMRILWCCVKLLVGIGIHQPQLTSRLDACKLNPNSWSSSPLTTTVLSGLTHILREKWYEEGINCIKFFKTENTAATELCCW